MSFSRKTIIYAAAPLTLAGVLATTAGATAASAAVTPPRHAACSVELGGAGGTLQYETFLALQGFGRLPRRGRLHQLDLRPARLRRLGACPGAARAGVHLRRARTTTP